MKYDSKLCEVRAHDFMGRVSDKYAALILGSHHEDKIRERFSGFSELTDLLYSRAMNKFKGDPYCSRSWAKHLVTPEVSKSIITTGASEHLYLDAHLFMARYQLFPGQEEKLSVIASSEQEAKSFLREFGIRKYDLSLFEKELESTSPKITVPSLDQIILDRELLKKIHAEPEIAGLRKLFYYLKYAKNEDLREASQFCLKYSPFTSINEQTIELNHPSKGIYVEYEMRPDSCCREIFLTSVDKKGEGKKITWRDDKNDVEPTIKVEEISPLKLESK
jgi:hypothetical protein